uniref:WGS project CAEQ00000000 data, annotated contig 952 n=1 Tax=Trypanosoma congolense (strain IL3000) TaxID=1068625 RepID=F9WJU4_TRYCI|nr:unnamed protein product [Trypanosoma congolense IL3000]
MLLVDRRVEGLHCGAVLAPRGWSLRTHHDVLDSCSMSVAQFVCPDSPSAFLYVAEQFIKRIAAGSEAPGDLADFLTGSMGAAKSPLCSTWEVCPPPHGGVRNVLAALLKRHALLISVVFSSAGEEKGASRVAACFDEIVCSLKKRYAALVEEEEEGADRLDWTWGGHAIVTERGGCVVRISSRLALGTMWRPLPRTCNAVALFKAATELGFLSENLHITTQTAHGDDVEVAVVLLPLRPGVCLMKRSAVRRVFEKHIRSGGWRFKQLMTPEHDPGRGAVLAGSTVYLLVDERNSTPCRIVAQLVEPRVGSDSCVVLLTIPPKTIVDPTDDSTPVTDAGVTESVTKATSQCQAYGQWLLSAFNMSIATTTSWSTLCVGKGSGFLFRQRNLVVQLPAASARYVNASVEATASVIGGGSESTSLGSVTVEADDTEDNTRRRVIVALLREFRCVEDYVDFIITEYAYETPLERKSAVTRRRESPVSTLLDPKETNQRSSSAHTFWIRLGDHGAVHYAVRECGVGRLLLMQAFVMGLGNADDVAVQRWESWVAGVGVATVESE